MKKMKKSVFCKLLTFLFVFSLFSISSSLNSCKSGPKYQKSRNGGKKINSSGQLGNRKNKNNHVWGK